MAKERSARSRRCVHCGNPVPASRKGRPVKCPTCGAAQEFETDRLMRRGPGGGLTFVHRVGAGIGAVMGFGFGLFFGFVIFRSAEPVRLALLMIACAVGWSVLGSGLAVTSIILWTRE